MRGKVTDYGKKTTEKRKMNHHKGWGGAERGDPVCRWNWEEKEGWCAQESVLHNLGAGGGKMSGTLWFKNERKQSIESKWIEEGEQQFSKKNRLLHGKTNYRGEGNAL